MPLDKEVILDLREEYQFAKASETDARATVEEIRVKWEEAAANLGYWIDRVSALETILNQDDGGAAKIDKFATFGD